MPLSEADGPKKAAQVLAWSALIASTLVLASLLQVVATVALAGPARPAAGPLSSVIAAMAAGDIARARSQVSWPGGAIGGASFP
jgi:hypothetical protein